MSKIDRHSLMHQVPAICASERLGAVGSVRSLYLWCDARESDLPNRAAPVSLGWQQRKRAQSSLGSSEGGRQRNWRLRGEGSEGNATEMKGIGRKLTENWGNY